MRHVLFEEPLREKYLIALFNILPTIFDFPVFIKVVDVMLFDL